MARRSVFKLPEAFPIRVTSGREEIGAKTEPEQWEALVKAHEEMPLETLDNIERLANQMLSKYKNSRRTPVWAMKAVSSSTSKKVRYAAQIVEAIHHIRPILNDPATKKGSLSPTQILQLNFNWANLCRGYGALLLFLVENKVAKSVKQQRDASAGGKAKRENSDTARYQQELEKTMGENPNWNVTSARRHVAKHFSVSLSTVATYTQDPKSTVKRRGLRNKSQ